MDDPDLIASGTARELDFSLHTFVRVNGANETTPGTSPARPSHSGEQVRNRRHKVTARSRDDDLRRHALDSKPRKHVPHFQDVIHGQDKPAP
jgi:hypothetical protein